MRYAALLLTFAALPLLAQPMESNERDFALSSLHASRKAFLDSIAGLSAAQWKYKPAPDRWSIAEVAEHVVLTEDTLFGLAQKTMQTPAVNHRKIDHNDGPGVLARMQDRSQKAKNPPELSPTGRFASADAVAQKFKERRDKTIAYARTTEDDVRAHVFNMGPQSMDVYQILVMMAGHADRHVAQINEVKAAPGYPKK